MNMLSYMKPLITAFILLLAVATAHPDERPCGSQIVAGNRIMASTVSVNNNLVVEFLKNGSPIPCGSTFLATDTLSVQHNINLNTEFFIELQGGAKWKTPNLNFCQTRQYKFPGVAYKQSEITIGTATSITQYAASASGQTSLVVSNKCTITKDISPTPAPTLSPTKSPVERPRVEINPWTKDGDFSSFSTTGFATIGLNDILRFTSNSDVDRPTVYRLPNQQAFESCNFTGATLYNYETANTVQIFVEQSFITLSTDKIYFSSDQGDDCSSGKLKVFFTPSFNPPPTSSPTSGAPTSSPIVPISVAVTWNLEESGFKSELNVAAGNALRLAVTPGANSIVQFPDQETFDACDVTAPGVKVLAENIADSVYSVDVSSQYLNGNYFLGSKQIDPETGETFCKSGQKINFSVLPLLSPFVFVWAPTGSVEERQIFLREAQSILFKPSSSDASIYEFKDFDSLQSCNYSTAKLVEDEGNEVYVSKPELNSGDSAFFGTKVGGTCQTGIKLTVDIVRQSFIDPTDDDVTAPVGVETKSVAIIVVMLGAAAIVFGTVVGVVLKRKHLKASMFGVTVNDVRAEMNAKKQDVKGNGSAPLETASL